MPKDWKVSFKKREKKTALKFHSPKIFYAHKIYKALTMVHTDWDIQANSFRDHILDNTVDGNAIGVSRSESSDVVIDDRLRGVG